MTDSEPDGEFFVDHHDLDGEQLQALRTALSVAGVRVIAGDTTSRLLVFGTESQAQRGIARFKREHSGVTVTLSPRP